MKDDRLPKLLQQLQEKVKEATSIKNSIEKLNSSLISELKALQKPEQKAVDYSKNIQNVTNTLSQDIKTQTDTIKKTIKDIKIPQTDLLPLKKELARFNTILNDLLRATKEIKFPEITQNEVVFPQKANEALPVRLSDGKKFYNAVLKAQKQTQEAIKILQGGSSSQIFMDSGGAIQYGLVDADRHVQVDVIATSHFSGTGSDYALTLTNADTAYQCPASANVPSKDYVLNIYNGSGNDVFWGWTNSIAGTSNLRRLLPSGGTLSLDMATSQSIFLTSASAGNTIAYGTKERS